MFDFFDGKKKVVIGMIHIGALPGTPLYDEKGGMKALIEGAAADLEALQAGGVDAVMFGNENDRPYSLKAPTSSVAAMSAVVSRLSPSIRVPFGVNYLWDPVASVGIAAATGAKFVREIFTGVYASDMGLWVPDCDGALRARRDLGVRDLKLLFNINAEFAAPLDTRPLGLRARSAVFSSLADAILVSGPITGQATEQSDLNAVCAAVKDVPIFANTGVNLDNVTDVLGVADGCVVGTHFKVDGHTWNAVDTTRVKRFMDKVATLR
ncbi:BtpA/SgcQ family protein [Acidisoma cladoniae]|jgi:membrane complex biogenesis BtpA family protein|uniref:BtpA/SgcQ family protein n=1 Tax=Acidisoma cladoniae TaxID=3040935 RepID=UPI00254E0F99|nr:BtpA/SgcQ family protein [Acidisoma sp. PAMC 29798]